MQQIKDKLLRDVLTGHMNTVNRTIKKANVQRTHMSQEMQTAGFNFVFQTLLS